MVLVLNKMSVAIIAVENKRPSRNLGQEGSRILRQRMKCDPVNGDEHNLGDIGQFCNRSPAIMILDVSIHCSTYIEDKSKS
jgi:hypothetical protein